MGAQGLDGDVQGLGDAARLGSAQQHFNDPALGRRQKVVVDQGLEPGLASRPLQRQSDQGGRRRTDLTRPRDPAPPAGARHDRVTRLLSACRGDQAREDRRRRRQTPPLQSERFAVVRQGPRRAVHPHYLQIARHDQPRPALTLDPVDGSLTADGVDLRGGGGVRRNPERAA
ncbi:hypothetical protein D3C85_1233820 [compost metagenome]